MKYLRELDQSPWFIPATSLFLYLAACVLPCLEFDTATGDHEVWYGFSLLLQGWMAVLVGQTAWMANPLWLLAMIFFVLRRWTISITCSLAGIFLAGITFLLFRQKVATDLDGVIIPLQQPKIGVYVWLLSLLVIFGGALFMRHRQHTAGQNPVN